MIAESAAILTDDLLHVCCSEVTSRYNPFTFLYREGYDETCRYIVDLLKYFQVKGLFCTGAFNALPGHILKNVNPNNLDQVPFGQQVNTNTTSFLIDSHRPLSSLIHPSTQYSICSLFHSTNNSFIQNISSIHPFIYSSILSLVHSSIHPLIHYFIHTLIHLISSTFFTRF